MQKSWYEDLDAHTSIRTIYCLKKWLVFAYEVPGWEQAHTDPFIKSELQGV